MKRIDIRTAVIVAALGCLLARRGAEAATCAAAAAGGEWRSYGHDYSNTRHQDLETTIGPPQAATLDEAWSHSASSWGGSGDFPGTPVIADGCVYAGSTGGWVFAANADTGELVWKTQFPGGATWGSVAVPADVGKVFAGVSSGGHLAVAALDQMDGHVVWKKEVDTQNGAEIYSSAVYFDGMVIIGVSGGSAELSAGDVRSLFHGSVVLRDANDGHLIQKIFTVPLGAMDPTGHEYAGGGVWAPTPAIDPISKYGYFSVGNPFNQQYQHENTDAIVKIDLDPSRTSTFGTIVGRYNGNVDQYYPGASSLPCVTLLPSGVPPYYPTGLGACGDLDLDFGTSPNIFSVNGQQLVGAGQKSGVYHAFRSDTMEGKWTALVGLPSAIGGIVGSATYDGAAITGPVTQLGYLWSVNASDGIYRWLAPVVDGAHYGQPVTSANGVMYTVDLKGFLDAFDAATGAPLLIRPMALGSPTGGGSPVKTDPILSLGGVAVARNTVYASVGTIGGLNGYIIAYRPAQLP